MWRVWLSHYSMPQRIDATNSKHRWNFLRWQPWTRRSLPDPSLSTHTPSFLGFDFFLGSVIPYFDDILLLQWRIRKAQHIDKERFIEASKSRHCRRLCMHFILNEAWRGRPDCPGCPSIQYHCTQLRRCACYWHLAGFRDRVSFLRSIQFNVRWSLWLTEVGRSVI